MVSISFLIKVRFSYSFLMNTSHNKDRILEDGWKNVFRNLIGCSNTSSAVNDHNLKDNYGVRNKNNIELINKNADYKYTNNTHGQGKRTENRNDNEIFTITKVVTNHPTNDTGNSSMLHVPFNEEPSTSKGQNAQKINNPASITLDVNRLIPQDDSHAISQKLISDMTTNITMEEKYIDYFKQLVSFEDDCRKGTVPTELSNEYEPPKTFRNKYSKCKGKRSEPTMKQSIAKKQCMDTRYDRDVGKIDDSKLDIHGEKENRTLMRKEILTKLQCCYSKDNTYGELLEQLINMEESFVQY